VDYGACLDQESFDKVFEKCEITVFPSVREGVDWERFKKNIGTDEPISQIGLEFDTVVDKKLSDDGMYTVKSSTPAVFVVGDCSKVYEKLREKKGEGIKVSSVEDLFQKCVERGVKVNAYTKCNVLRHYSHECVGNILEAVGVSCKRENEGNPA
jgi:hypothetical protein